MAQRLRVAIATTALALSVVSCGGYKLQYSGADVSSLDLAPGDRVKVHLRDGAVMEDTVVWVSDDALICRFNEYARSDIVAVERWQSETAKTVGVAAGAGTTLYLVLLAVGLGAFWAFITRPPT